MRIYPALLTRQSMRPTFSIAWDTVLCTSLAVMSSFSHCPPRASISGTASAAFDGFRAVAMTLWPAFSAPIAIAAPRPEEAPVTSQTFCCAIPGISCVAVVL